LKLLPNPSLIAYIESLTEPTLDTQYNNTAGANPDRRLYEYKSYCHEKTQTHIQIFFYLENIIRVRTLFEAKNQMSFKIFTLLKRVKSGIQSKAKKETICVLYMLVMNSFQHVTQYHVKRSEKKE
jgi:hypothetical protein